MKKAMFSVLLMAGGVLFTSSCSNDKTLSLAEVPPAVVQSFNTKYPGATEVTWKTETIDGKKVYDAEFKTGGKSLDAEFDEAGTFVREEE